MRFWSRRTESYGSGCPPSLPGKKHFNLRAFGGRLSQLEENIAGIKLPALLVADFSQGSQLDLEVLERLKKSHFAKVPVIAISSHLDQQLVRGLLADQSRRLAARRLHRRRNSQQLRGGHPHAARRGERRQAQMHHLFPGYGRLRQHHAGDRSSTPHRKPAQAAANHLPCRPQFP